MKYINKVKKYGDIRFILLLCTLWFGYSFLFNKYSYSFGIIFSALYILIFINLNLQRKLYAIIFALPFASIFKVSPNLPSMMMILYIIYIIDTMVINEKRIELLDIICITGLAATQILGVLIYEGSIVGVVSFILNIIFMRVCILNLKEIENTKKDKVLIKTSLIFSISMILSIIIADIFPQIPYIVLPEKQMLLMSIDRFNGLNGDPNYYSQLVLVAVSLLLGVIKIKNINGIKVLSILMSIFLILSGFRSRSKSYGLTIIVLLVLFFIYLGKRIIKETTTYKNILTFIVIVLISVVSVYYVVFDIVIPLIESRTDSGDLLTGRGDIWIQYIEMIKNNLFTIISGVGFSNSGNTLNQFIGIYKAPHNVYIELLVEVGIVGLMFILCIFRNLILNINKIIGSEFFIYIVMFAVTSIGLSLSSNDAIFILLPIAVLVEKTRNQENNLLYMEKHNESINKKNN